jgi:uncharacterized repeat protein (TIGR04138 family)
MTPVQFAEEMMERLCDRNPRYHGRAYLFMLSALQEVSSRLERPRHVSGGELAEGCRRLAQAEFGPMARTVLGHWGIHGTEDFGEIVFTLVDAGILVKEDQDRVEDFRDLFDFEEVFERQYPWSMGR